MFKRREKRSWDQRLLHLVWPRGGWARAVEYIRHRLKRLPDSPQRIARGIASGVFVSFTPLFGMHFLLAALVAKLIRGNILAALLATFFGNPVTYLPIAASALKTGHFILGRRPEDVAHGNLGQTFAGAWADLFRNLRAVFTDAPAEWSNLSAFYHDLFLPFLVGGIFPGTLCAVVCYALAVPVIRTYQNRRKKTLAARRAKRQLGAAKTQKTDVAG